MPSYHSIYENACKLKKYFLIRVFWLKYMIPIKFKIRILDLMLLPKDSVPFEGQYYSNWIFPMHIDTISMELSLCTLMATGTIV